MFVLHETCLEYFRRRLSEGWECISLEGHNAVLLSPDGIRRELNLRNDIDTLRPNAAGDYTNIASQYPDSGAHWDKVDEAPPDEAETYVYTPSTVQQKDAYNLSAPSGNGTINSVTVFFRATMTRWDVIAYAQPFLRLGVNETAGTEVSLFPIGYVTKSEALTRPGGGDWMWADLADLQVAIGIRTHSHLRAVRLTQVYVEVDYTPILTTNAAIGITPASAILNGVLLDDLGEVWEVRFQWGKTEDYGNDTAWQAGFSTGDTFTQLINTLEPGTLYHFRAQANNSLGIMSGPDVSFWTLKPSVGKAYAFSRELHIKRTTDVLDMASIADSEITTLADCKGINLTEVPSSLTLTVEATYDGSATQGIKVHVRTSLTDRATGAHTGADGAAALTDAEAHFVVNELIGLTIKNLTDGSSGVITANTATAVTATLVGGTNNDWDSGDAYIIEGAGYDTEDWDSFTPAFGAGSSIRQTEHYDVDPVFLKAFVENLDPAEEVIDVKIIMAVGT